MQTNVVYTTTVYTPYIQVKLQLGYCVKDYIFFPKSEMIAFVG